ncbi:hypothetical protein ABPG74_000655 [Tetrahymena malaccensis]
MFYVFTTILVIISCILQGLFYSDVSNSQNSNFSQIVSMWQLDPINQIALVQPGQSCPDGLSVYDQILNLPQSSSLCSCETTSTQFSIYINQQLVICGQCSKDTIEVKRFQGIPQKNLIDQFYVQDYKGDIQRYRVCINRIKGYSFVKKAPSSTNCQSNEQLCSWPSSSNTDYSYCIPQQYTCFSDGINIPNQNFYLQLPLIDIKNNSYSFQILNFQPAGQFTQQQIYDQNKIIYQQQFIPFFSQTPILNQILVTYPYVKLSCRDSFKTAFASYSGQSYGLNIAAGLVVVITVAALMGIVLSIYDVIDFNQIVIKKQEPKMSYWIRKRFSLQNTTKWNVFIITKPLVILISFILYILICQNYLVAPIEMKKLINNSCVDLSLKYIFSYFSDYSQSDLPREFLVYVALVFLIFAFFSDQVVIQAFNYLAHKLGIVKLVNKMLNKNDKQKAQVQQIPTQQDQEIKNNQQENINPEINTNQQSQQINGDLQYKIESPINNLTPQNTEHIIQIENIEHDNQNQQPEQVSQSYGLQMVPSNQPQAKPLTTQIYKTHFIYIQYFLMTEQPETARIASQHNQITPQQNTLCSIQLLNDNEDEFQEDPSTSQQLANKILNIQTDSNALICNQNEKTWRLFDSTRQDSISANQSLKILNEAQRQILMQILQQSQMTAQEKEILLKIIPSLPAFSEKKIHNDQLMDSSFLENIELISLQKGSCLFNFGDQSDGYYTLLDGFCYVTIPKEKIKKHLEILNVDKFSDENLKRAYKVLSQSDFQSIQEYFKWPTLKHIPNQITLKILDAGQSFGETSLIFGKKRTASVICGSECKIMKIQKQYFERLVDKEEQNIVLNERIDFLSQISFLNDLPKIIIQTLIQESETLNLQRGSNIYKYGEKADSIYLIQEGTIQICKKVSNQVVEKDTSQQKSNISNQQNINLQKQRKAQISRSNTLNRYEKQICSIQQTEMQPIVILDKGQYFGEDQVFSSEQIRNSQAQVQSPQAIVIAIKINLLVLILIEYNCLEVLFKEIELKQQFNSKRQQLISVQNQKQSQKKIKLQSNFDLIQQVQQSLMSNREFVGRSTNLINQQDLIHNSQQESQNFIFSQKRILSPMTSPKSCRFDSQKTNLNFEMKLDKHFSQQSQNQPPKIQNKLEKQDKNEYQIHQAITQKVKIERGLEINQEHPHYNIKEQIDSKNVTSKNKNKKSLNNGKNKTSSEIQLDGKKNIETNLFQIKSAQFGTQATNTTLNTIPSLNNINSPLYYSSQNNQNQLKQSNFVKNDLGNQQNRDSDDIKSPKNNNVIQKIDFDFLKQQYMQLSTLTKLKQIKQEHIKRKDHFRQLQESSQKLSINIQQEQSESQVSSPLPYNKKPLKKSQQNKPKLDLLNYLYERGIETERIVYKERRNPKTDRSSSDQNQIKLFLSKEQFFQNENAQNSLTSQLTSGLNKFIKTEQKITDNKSQALKVIPAIYIEDSLNEKVINQKNCKINTINTIENDKSTLNLTNRTLRSQNVLPLSKQNQTNINLHTLNLPKISSQQKPYIRMKQFSLHHINKTSEQN